MQRSTPPQRSRLLRLSSALRYGVFVAGARNTAMVEHALRRRTSLCRVEGRADLLPLRLHGALPRAQGGIRHRIYRGIASETKRRSAHEVSRATRGKVGFKHSPVVGDVRITVLGLCASRRTVLMPFRVKSLGRRARMEETIVSIVAVGSGRGRWRPRERTIHGDPEKLLG